MTIDYDAIRALHRDEVIAVHESHGAEVWCPRCEQHWPCDAARLLAVIDAVRAEHPALRPEGNAVTPDTPDYCGGDHGGNPPAWVDCPTIRALDGTS